MIGLGFVVLFAGYSVMTYGWSQLRGSNASFVSLIWPGSFKGASPDVGGSNSGTTTTPGVGGSGTTTAPNTKANSNPITAPPSGSSGPVRDYNPNQVAPQGLV